MRSIDDLRQRQSLPLGAKVAMTNVRILEWIKEWGENGVYVSFSGGKDSTVLLHLVRQMFPEVEAVFFDTGLEYPEVRQFVKQVDNVTIIKPKLNFKEVICKYGYPMISKEVSEKVAYAKKGSQWALSAVNGERTDKDGRKSPYNCDKYKSLLNVDFNISKMCCNTMKKSPAKTFERESGKKVMMAQMAEESRLRTQHWLQNGCNGFDMGRPVSNPMSFWTEQDVLQYILENHIEIPLVYGDIIQTDCGLCTTGCSRTGCCFCGYGLQNEKGETRFQRLKRTHPKLYDYCIGGGAYDPEDGIWKPDKNGLGMGHVFDELNKLYGENYIRYK